MAMVGRVPAHEPGHSPAQHRVTAGRAQRPLGAEKSGPVEATATEPVRLALRRIVEQEAAVASQGVCQSPQHRRYECGCGQAQPQSAEGSLTRVQGVVEGGSKPLETESLVL